MLFVWRWEQSSRGPSLEYLKKRVSFNTGLNGRCSAWCLDEMEGKILDIEFKGGLIGDLVKIEEEMKIKKQVLG